MLFRSLKFAYFARENKDSNSLFIANIKDLIDFADIIWLTIKPQDLQDILSQIATLRNRDGKVFVSPVAGKKKEIIEHYLGKQQPIRKCSTAGQTCLRPSRARPGGL